LLTSLFYLNFEETFLPHVSANYGAMSLHQCINRRQNHELDHSVM